MAFFRLLRKSPIIARIGLAMILLNIAAAVLAPVIAPYGETEVVGDVWMPMSSEHYLGTDHIGRDMFTRLLYGARNTIAIAFVITMCSFAVGISCGFFAATMGGWVDLILSRLVDILMAIPVLIFALVMLAIVGNSIPKLIVVIALLDSTRVYRLSRAVAMDIEVMEYVEAARLRGEGAWWLMRHGIRPAILFCIFIYRRPKLSGPGHPSPDGGLRRNGPRKFRRDYFRNFHTVVAGRCHRISDGRREFYCRLVFKCCQRTERLTHICK